MEGTLRAWAAACWLLGCAEGSHVVYEEARAAEAIERASCDCERDTTFCRQQLEARFGDDEYLERLECAARTFPGYDEALRASIACTLEVDRAELDCRARAACGPSATNDCNLEGSEARAACPEALAARATWNDAIDTCISLDGVVGSSDPTCPDEVAGTIGLVLVVTTTDAGDDYVPGCLDEAVDGPDVTVAWRAPLDGVYRIHTRGSDFDTALSVLTSCRGDELACNDDIGADEVASEVRIEAVAGVTYIIVIDGYLRSGRAELHVELE